MNLLQCALAPDSAFMNRNNAIAAQRRSAEDAGLNFMSSPNLSNDFACMLTRRLNAKQEPLSCKPAACAYFRPARTSVLSNHIFSRGHMSNCVFVICSSAYR